MSSVVKKVAGFAKSVFSTVKSGVAFALQRVVNPAVRAGLKAGRIIVNTAGKLVMAPLKAVGLGGGGGQRPQPQQPRPPALQPQRPTIKITPPRFELPQPTFQPASQSVSQSTRGALIRGGRGRAGGGGGDEATLQRAAGNFAKKRLGG